MLRHRKGINQEDAIGVLTDVDCGRSGDPNIRCKDEELQDSMSTLTIALQVLQKGLVEVVVGVLVLFQPEDALPRNGVVDCFEHAGLKMLLSSSWCMVFV